MHVTCTPYLIQWEIRSAVVVFSVVMTRTGMRNIVFYRILTAKRKSRGLAPELDSLQWGSFSPLWTIRLMELQRNTHHVYRLMYHFVWIPKYRHKVFSEPYREVLKGIIEKIGYDYDIDIVELEIPEDHIHMVVRGEPKKSPSDVMQVIKSISAREFFRRFPQIKRRYFWGGKLWTQSYFVETIGNANEETIRKYVQNQLVESDKKETKSKQLNLF